MPGQCFASVSKAGMIQKQVGAALEEVDKRFTVIDDLHAAQLGNGFGDGRGFQESVKVLECWSVGVFYAVSRFNLSPLGMMARSRRSNNHPAANASMAAGMAPSKIVPVSLIARPAMIGSPSPP